MANVWTEEEKQRNADRGVTLADKVKTLEKKATLYERSLVSKEKTKQFKFPFKWRLKFRQSTKKAYNEMMLVFFLNKKGILEAPKFMPIFDGNMIVYKNKPYEFDPRAVWRVQMRGNPQAYLIKEIDRRPVRNKKGRIVYRDAAVSNLDVDEIRRRGDSTESDEFLIKAALKAQTSSMKKGVSMAAIVIILLAVAGGVIWFISS